MTTPAGDERARAAAEGRIARSIQLGIQRSVVSVRVRIEDLVELRGVLKEQAEEIARLEEKRALRAPAAAPDICEITGKHVEAASPSDRYCPCNTCQAYLRRILEQVKRTSP